MTNPSVAHRSPPHKASPSGQDAGAALICGSMAYDNIMVFDDQFKNHILPDKLDILNVSFLISGMRREFGGCAGNIAYSLAALGGRALPMATVGNDFSAYADWMDTRGITRRYLEPIHDALTGQAFVITDRDNNQITAFYPGAMSFSHHNTVGATAGEDIRLGIVSPDGREGMIRHAAELAQRNIPFLFDPGQGMPMFGKEELNAFLEQATWVAVNGYEWEMLRERTGLSAAQVLERVQALIVTQGAKGSVIHTAKGQIEVPVLPVAEALDPTGCGDAYRGGILYGLLRGMDWETMGRIATLMGSINAEYMGTQSYRLTPDEIKERFTAAFGYSY
uniref:Adenosine kinase n=1 Tax=Candidatus Kentrum sp. FM TaxID=2126340 RepID=A0A450WQX9_9GAMM|nr:MAG: adenosine kinase [Candidatus Kentron sp. FM]VFJ72164.1 MAG: adenosine kinase [Candidatus Kentron sp. FM]VFK19384.1 MAG: adenosine kinase [Candidatus Kentron sp. FM]